MDLPNSLRNDLERCAFEKLRATGSPIETLQLICENYTRGATTFRETYLEGIPFHLARDRTKKAQADLRIVILR